MPQTKQSWLRFWVMYLWRVPKTCQNELITTSGFTDTDQAWSSFQSESSQLKSNHKEDDTWLILHVKEAKEVGYSRVVIQCHDTDVLVLAVGHRKHLPSEIWMSCGSSEKPKCIPVHAINYPPLVMDSVIAYHPVTGCDTTSQFSGKANQSTWKVCLKDPTLFTQLGETPGLSEEATVSAEQFVCGIYCLWIWKYLLYKWC